MATLQQLEEGIRRAHAAGNAEHVKKLGAEYRRLQAGAGGAAEPTVNMSVTDAFARKQKTPPPANPQKSVLPGPLGAFQDFSNSVQSGFNQGLTLGFGDEIYAGAAAPFRALGDAVQGKGFDLGRAYNDTLDVSRQAQSQQAALNPVASGAGEVTGAIVNPVSRFLAPVKGASTAANVTRGLVGGGATGAAYGFGSDDGDLASRGRSALIGGGAGAGLGVVAPWLAKKGGEVVQGILQNRATSAAVKNAPSADALKAASRQTFQAVDDAGVTVDTDKFSGLVQRLVTQAKRDRINPNLDPKATGAFQELIGALDDVQKNGAALTVSDLHTLRQIAQSAAVSTEGRDRMFANRIIDALDNFVTGPGNVKLPTNRLGKTAGGNELLSAISTWGRARRVGLLEEATYKAQNAASGFENGLRVEFRKLLQNKKTRALFTKAEIAEIEKVANGTPLSNALRTIGHLGFDFGSGRNFIGGMTGLFAGNSVMGPLGALAVGATGAAARKGGQALTRRAADRAARVVATPNVPNVRINNPLLPAPGGALSLPVTDQFQPRPLPRL